MSPNENRRELVATLLVAILGGALASLFAAAQADGYARQAETPFRAVLGNERYEALMAGEGGAPHYLGASLEAPDFTLTDRDGEPWTLSEHRGEVLVLNFWNTTCRPCIEELPSLKILGMMAQRWDDVQVVTISTDTGWDVVSPFVDADEPLTQLLDSDKRVVADLFGTSLYPETWVVDREGVIRFRYDGAYDWSSPVILDVIDAYR